MRLVITGASGKLGRRTAELALERCSPDQLILVTRTPAALDDLAARGVSVRFGDFSAPKGLQAAFAGGDRLLLISTTDLARRSEQHAAAIEAAVAARIAHVIYTSIVSPAPPNPAVVAPSHYFTETALARSGLAVTILRNSLYADFQVPEAAHATGTGSFVHNRGDGQVAYVAREDCAAVAAAVLTTDGHAARVYDVTGPQRWRATELADLYGELGGRKVAAVALDDAAFVAGLLGSSERDAHMRYGAELVASFGRAIREGYMASCSDTVAELTGRPARALRTVLEEQLRATPSRAV
jgi:NAD(P)H dehydrogenase (quinone)